MSKKHILFTNTWTFEIPQFMDVFESLPSENHERSCLDSILSISAPLTQRWQARHKGFNWFLKQKNTLHLSWLGASDAYFLDRYIVFSRRESSDAVFEVWIYYDYLVIVAFFQDVLRPRIERRSRFGGLELIDAKCVMVRLSLSPRRRRASTRLSPKRPWGSVLH